VVLLGRTSAYQTWLTPVIIAGAVVAAVGLWLGGQLHHKALVMAAAVVAGVTLLAGPAAYAVTTVRSTVGGSLVAAGPSSGGAGIGGMGIGAGRGGTTTSGTSGLVKYLEANQGSARYLVAAFGSQSSASIIIESGKPVVTIGGFNGGDPAPTLDQFKAMVANGEVKYVLVGGGGPGGGFGGPGGGGPGGGGGSSSISSWVTSNGTAVDASAYGGATNGTLYLVTASS
jgi:hypothetical protein